MKPSLPRSVLILVVALVVGGLAAFAVKRHIEREIDEMANRDKAQAMVQVLVPKRDLPKGSVLGVDAVAVRSVPQGWRHSNAITPEQFDRVEHQRLAYPVVRGEMLLWSLLEGQGPAAFSSRLTAGRRAITFPVDEVNSISGMLVPGDHIDLVATLRKDSRSLMLPLLQNVLVLATGATADASVDGREARRTYTTITLEASPDEAQRVLAAREVGKLAAVLRPPADVSTTPSSHREAWSVLGIEHAEQREATVSVPVLYGGAGAQKDAVARIAGRSALASADAAPLAAPRSAGKESPR